MEDVEFYEDSSTPNNFPLCKTLENLYFALLEASSYANEKEYNIFDIKNKKCAAETRSKALVVFSEFDITGYALGASEIIPFDPPLNSSAHVEDNLKKIKQFLIKIGGNLYYTLGEFDECKCTVKIKHKFQVKNRITGKEIFPIGRICIMKFAYTDTDTLKIMEKVSKLIMVSEEKRRVHLELKLMRLEDKVVRKKHVVCNYDCPCKLIASTNKIQLDPLLFDITKINSKQYMNDYMKALGLGHIVSYV